jgi:hypothetical protein
VVAVAAIKAVTRLLVVVQGCVFAMEAASAARLRDALKVPKDILGYAFHMAVDEGEFPSSSGTCFALRSFSFKSFFWGSNNLGFNYVGSFRCQFAGCTKGAQGSTMFCKAHGGGKRCIIQDCNKGAEGSTPLCKGHGGGKRCAFDGGGICTKSVHGGTLFCVAHGGGKRCAVEGCGKSARGRTDFCVRHGGGKRCKVDGCGKSAQGSTDFCKAHGGGKRCQWGQEGSNLGDLMRDKNGEQVSQAPCDKFARGKTGLCAAHSALVSDRQVHGGSAVGSAVTPGLAPGLFRGLVTGAGQNRPNPLVTTSTGTETAATGGRPVGSVSVEMSRATDSPVVSGTVASTYILY